VVTNVDDYERHNFHAVKQMHYYVIIMHKNICIS